MKSAGIIVEYNPMHNGHILHLEETKKRTNADVIIAVMSGNFLQRGEPAMLPKYIRTDIALQQGVDIVIELPYPYATQKAETFANGAISILNTLKVDELCFGSESGEINELQALSVQYNHVISSHIKKEMKKGISYPAALSNTLSSKDSTPTLPNNILGMHYIEAINRQQANIIPKTIKRVGSNYHDETFNGHIASATSIRKSLFQEYNLESIQSVVPSEVHTQIEHYLSTYRLLHHWELYFPFLQYQVLSSTKDILQHIYEAEEGLENRLISVMKESNTFAEFMSTLKTKRYTWNRLQRLCLHTLLQVTKDDMQCCTEQVPFIRLLGMTKNGQKYLSSIKKGISIPIVANTKSLTHPLIEMEKKATAVYYSVLPAELRLNAIRDEWFHHPIIR